MSGALQAVFQNQRSFSSAPVNTVAPAVTGTTTVGQTLTSTTGTWTGLPTPTFTYQWQRVTTNISAATSSTYVLVAADVGSTIRCVVTATNTAGAVSANSNNTATVTAVTGQQLYTGATNLNWTAPTGVTSVSVVVTGSSQQGYNNGGDLSYKNNITVVPGSTYAVFIPNKLNT